MLEISKATEERYTAVADGLVELGYEVQTGVLIAANIIGICESILLDKSTEEIVEDYGLKCKPQSFNGIFRTYTGMNVKDIPKIFENQERISKLRDLGYGDKEIGEIFNIMEG